MAADLAFEGFEGAVEAGWGGFAVVYRARQPRFDREVAIKVLNVAGGTDAAQAFERECAAIGSLSGHPNIVTVHGVGETSDGRPFIVMEYLHGGSLGDAVRARGPLPWAEAAGIGVALAGALETAHRAGILHRDVKPENVLVSRYGQPKLGDFGIARFLDTAAGGSGGVAGSLRHLAPEVLAGSPPTTASDVYSLGSTLYTILVGRSPAGAGARPEGVPDALAGVVEQALAEDPHARPASAEEVGRRLQAALAAEGSAVPELAVDGRRTGRRRRRLGAGVAAAALVALAGALLLARDSPPAVEQAAPATTTSTTVTPTTTTATTTPPPRPGSFTDDFTSNQVWARTGRTGTVVSEGLDGQYRLLVTLPEMFTAATGFLIPAPVSASPAHHVRIEADATKVSTGRADFGVACGGPDDQFPYGAMVDDGGWWRIFRTRNRNFPLDVVSGRDQAVVRGPGPHRIGLDCRGEGESVSLALTVDGAEVATATAARGTAFGGGMGLMILPLVGPVEVLFDNVAVTYS